MRCIEIVLIECIKTRFFMINSNMRCIEIKISGEKLVVDNDKQ